MSFRDRIKSWDIVGQSKIWFTISIIVILLGLISMGINWVKTGSPLNLGIDFKGGTVLSLACETKPDAQKVRDIVASLGYKDAIVQEALGNKIIVKINTTTISEEDQTKIENEIDKLYKIKKDSIQITSIAPVIGAELMKNGSLALGLALLFVLLYISIRFEYKIALSTILALLHDVLVTLGLLSLFRVELNAPFIGAFLAIITYSVEDTVVVMDRIREKLKFRLKESFRKLVNDSITEVWVRSMNTSITTLFSSLALLIFGGSAIRDFSSTFLIGLISGTYSSIYIASPLLILFKGETIQKELERNESVVTVVENAPGSVESKETTKFESVQSEQEEKITPPKTTKKKSKKNDKKRK
ncbi:MAG: protein translocase subunit SecF [Caldisericaceae bacterium]